MFNNKWLAVNLFVCALAVACSGQEGQTPSVVFHPVSEHLFEIQGGRGARGGVYFGENGVLVIDAKMDKTSVSEVIEEIKKRSQNPILYLVNTHSDGDHIYGNQFFPVGLTFIAHENCRKEFFHPKRDGSESDWMDSSLAPYVPTVTFRDKMVLYLGSKRVELWHFGIGHTTGDAVVYFPEEKAAFMGDQLFLDRPQLIHAYKGGNSFAHVKNLKRMLEVLDAERFYSGHSDVTDRSGIQAHIEKMVLRQDRIKNLMSEGKDLETIIQAFPENETRLVQTIYHEIEGS